MAEISFLNGEYVNLNEAKISVLDRGFLFGDGIYEVIPVYGGHMFRLQRHFKRLQRSLSAIGLPGPYAESEWLEILEELIRRNKAEDVGIYLQITRGVAHRDHAFPQEVHPTVFAMVNPIKPMSSVVAERGVAAIALPDNRWARCDIKSISLLGNVLLRQQAVEQEAVEAILLRDGEVTEGAASNVFIVHKGIVKTPPKSDHLLPGVTRDLIVDLLSDSDLVCEEASIPESDLREADEIWMTSSTKEIVPITCLDNQVVGDGRPGAIWKTVYKIYQDCKSQWREGGFE